MAGSISSAGIGSGLDVSNIITKLMAVEQLPLTKLQNKATGMQTQLSAFGQMQSLVSSFQDATAPLFKADNYSLTSATSNDTASVVVSSTTAAAPGSYAVSVSSLASTQSLVSASGQFAAATETVGTGSLTIRLGTWSAGQTAFTPKADVADIVIPIGATEGTLAGIRDKINAAGAGLSASIVTDANGARLALQSSTTGAENGFRISVTDDDTTNTDNAGLSRLAFDPPTAAPQMALTQSAANTQATINGIAVASKGNTLTNVVEGMTFTLNKVTTSPVTVTVARNTASLKTMLTNFVAAYNALNGFIETTTKYDAAAGSGSLLQGDSTAVGLQNQLRTQIGQSGSSSAVFRTLSNIGIEFQRDGSLTLNDAKVTTALGNLPELQKALGAEDKGNPANNGFARKLGDWATKVLGTGGLLPSKTKAIQTRIAANQKDQVTMSERISRSEARLRAQYTALDSTMSKANALSAYVSQQITTWNKSTA